MKSILGRLDTAIANIEYLDQTEVLVLLTDVRNALLKILALDIRK